jgi:hypothetical protein
VKKPIGLLANLPPGLEYLIEPALKYGVHQDDVERGQFLQRIPTEDLEELACVAERYRLSEDHDLVGEFLDKYPITDHAESANLYFLFAVMDEAGLQISPENWNSVERHIRSLGKCGCFRLASERMWAARFLADFGDEARSAIPHLRRVTEDEDLRVRVWAHYALAIIEGRRQEHELAVRTIFLRHNDKDEIGEYGTVGMEANAALEKFRELG